MSRKKIIVLAMTLGIAANGYACICADGPEHDLIGKASPRHAHSHSSEAGSSPSTSDRPHDPDSNHTHGPGESCSCPGPGQDILSDCSSPVVSTHSLLAPDFGAPSAVLGLLPRGSDLPQVEDGDPPRSRGVPLYLLILRLTI